VKRIVTLALAVGALALLGSIFFDKPREHSHKVLILGIDGLDPGLLERFMGAGDLPNFKRVVDRGSFKPLQTSVPPQSPVAWSTFITGLDPGGHDIFDFLTRDPATLTLEPAMSAAVAPGWTIRLGSWRIPLTSGYVEQHRKGTAFWQRLEGRGVPTTVFRIPANFPPAKSSGRSISGMGTPDIRGTSGTFSYYTTDPPLHSAEINGGEIHEVEVRDDHVHAELVGPPNEFRVIAGSDDQPEHPNLILGFDVYFDPEEPAAKFEVQGHEFILPEGEWSDWIRVDFEAIPYLESVSAVGRFYLQSIRPEFKLYVTPLQINPEDPAMPISNPAGWSEELCDRLGYFYTQEFPEDTKAYTSGIFNGHEFWEQAQSVYRERMKALDYLLGRFDEGLLFFYFSSLDQGTHMLWGSMDPHHPFYEPDDLLQNGIRTLYREMDDAVGRALAHLDDDTTLIIMSDHGFAPFYRQVNLNTWLLSKRYVELLDPRKQGQYPLFMNVDWSRTRAYAVGLNGIYLNLKGREREGIVDPKDYDRVLDALERDLLELRDPKTGDQVVTELVRPRRDFSGPYAADGPDLIVGYNRGYRSSWTSPLGSFPYPVFVDNVDPWSGDHCIDHRLVPGVLISNRPITVDDPSLEDLTVAILDEYHVAKTAEMQGRDCLGE
jgi:predicted AlkP superfamily phosphohydrolase/phosphomutase